MNSINKQNPNDILALFDGMSCGQISLNNLCITYDKYYASEVDKFAMKVTNANFPNTIQLGDINKWKTWNIEWKNIKLILAGSPCQGFSFAGKQLNFNDERSALFFVFVDILNHVKKFNPEVKFLLENVKMKKEYLAIISEYVGVFPVEINSNLLSAQNRKRFYWTNIKTRNLGLFDNELISDIPQPKDKGILLKDILQDKNEVDEKYYLNNQQIELAKEKYKSKIWKSGNRMGNMKFPDDINRKSKCIVATQIISDRALNHIEEKYFLSEKRIKHFIKKSKKMKEIGNGFQFKPTTGNKKANTITTKEGGRIDSNYILKLDKELKIKNNQNKESCLTGGGNSGGNHSDMDLIGCIKFGRSEEGKRLRKESMKKGKDHTPFQAKEIIDIDFNKMNTITTSTTKDNLLTDGYKIRRLTPIECERLQTVPDNYTNHVSDSQRYKMLGNGWTIEIISWILNFLKLI